MKTIYEMVITLRMTGTRKDLGCRLKKLMKIVKHKKGETNGRKRKR